MEIFLISSTDGLFHSISREKSPPDPLEHLMGAENDISSFVLLIVPSSLSSSAVSLCSIDKTKSEIVSNQIELLH